MIRRALVPLLLLVSVACGGRAPATMAEAPDAALSEVALEKAADAGGATGGDGAAPGGATSLPIPADRKLVRNASLDVDVPDADAAVRAVEADVSQAGGYVQQLQIDGTREHGRLVSATLRIPATGYGGFVTTVRGLGEVTHVREWSDDVTDAYVDLEERLRTKEIHLERLQGHFAQAGTLHDMIELEGEIGRVTADLESMKGRMRVLANQVDFSTFTLTLREPGAPVVHPPDSVWGRLTTGFRDAITGVVNATGGLLVGLAIALPWLLWFAVVATLGLGACALVLRGVFVVGRRLFRRG